MLILLAHQHISLSILWIFEPPNTKCGEGCQEENLLSRGSYRQDLPSKGGSLARNTLLQASVTGNHESVVVEELEAGLVVGGSHVGLTDGQTDSVSETLTEGTLFVGYKSFHW